MKISANYVVIKPIVVITPIVEIHLIKWLLPFILVLCPATTFAANAAEGEQRPLIKLQLKWQHQFQFAGYYAAVEKGFYQDAGLDVELIEATPGTEPIDEVIQGRADYGVGTSELVINRHHGEPVVVLGVIFQHSPLELLTLASSGLDNIHKLSGKKLMIEPSSAELFAYLQNEGFQKKAFQIVPHTHQVQDIISRRVDAMSIYITDEVFELESMGIRYQTFSPRMSGIDFYGDNLFTLQNQIENNHQQTIQFYEASMKGWKYAMANVEEMIDIIHDDYSSRKSKAQLRFEAMQMKELMQPELIEPGYMHIGRWQHIADTYHSIGLLPKTFDVASMLYFPANEKALNHVKSRLNYAFALLFSVSVICFAIWHLYRKSYRIHQQLNTIFMKAPLSLIVVDDKFHIKRWNRQAETTFLWKADEVIGKNVLDLLVDKEIQLEIGDIIQDVNAHRTTVRSENKNIRKDGKEILCEWINAPFKEEGAKSYSVVCMARDITNEKALQTKLEHAAHYDALTGLPNRKLVLELLKQSLLDCERNNSQLALLFIDLDDFKQINDNHGHHAGDIVLQTLSQRLKNSLRASDVAGRLAGDEFIVVIKNVDKSQLVDNIVKKIENVFQESIRLDDAVLFVKGSIGYSLYPEQNNLKDLMKDADKAMYRAKQRKKRAHIVSVK